MNLLRWNKNYYNNKYKRNKILFDDLKLFYHDRSNTRNVKKLGPWVIHARAEFMNLTMQ